MGDGRGGEGVRNHERGAHRRGEFDDRFADIAVGWPAYYRASQHLHAATQRRAETFTALHTGSGFRCANDAFGNRAIRQ